MVSSDRFHIRVGPLQGDFTHISNYFAFGTTFLKCLKYPPPPPNYIAIGTLEVVVVRNVQGGSFFNV